ncbi:hypothetical protein GWK47_051739 [Chionoecetes opilio]|uniref:Uncharacterized protein n=1 Tax=Chionoecetes opilio TaxID=41210 RepID=A0A8J4Y0H7_CHIOP|nr:hypothetical protein GWK47_051739 [Chionoecetes opilio]
MKVSMRISAKLDLKDKFQVPTIYPEGTCSTLASTKTRAKKLTPAPSPVTSFQTPDGYGSLSVSPASCSATRPPTPKYGSYVKEEKFIVFKNCLWGLFDTCPTCIQAMSCGEKISQGDKGCDSSGVPFLWTHKRLVVTAIVQRGYTSRQPSAEWSHSVYGCITNKNSESPEGHEHCHHMFFNIQ